MLDKITDVLRWSGHRRVIIGERASLRFRGIERRAIEEMIRVARPGTKILIVDETEKVVKNSYEKLPILRKYFEKRTEQVGNPVELVPTGMLEAQSKEMFDGRLYCLTFRKP